MIPQSFIQELLNRLDIVDVVERYVPLKKAGANYVACCPFHNEKTPSFSVSPAKQFYHCFGCGAHGSAISFVMEHQGLNFPEAVEELAKNIGLPVPHETTQREQDTRTAIAAGLPETMQQALRYYREQLKLSEPAIQYFKGRGVSGDIAAKFGLGYAPEGWQNLSAVFPDYATSTALVETGLIIENDEGRRYDRFRDRVMFPILNARGNVIGFGGRVLGAGEPKYLNSPETALFQKGQELYGLFQARNAIRNAGRVLVVEGYMDVVALVQHGVEYAVATLGTATTPVHVQKLLRAADEIIFCFDGDKAGRRAAWRALENSLGALTDSARLLFLFLPEGEDPDTYVRQVGKNGFEASYGDALTLSQFLFKEITRELNLTTDEGRAKLVQTAKPLIEKIAAPALQMMLRKRLAELTGLSAAELTSLLPQTSAAVPTRAPKVKSRRAPSLARQLLRMVLLRPDLAREAAMEPLDEENAEVHALRGVLDLIRRQPQIDTHAAILEALRGAPEEALLAEVAGEALAWDEAFDVAQEFNGALEQLRAQARQKRIDSLLALAKTQALSPEQKQALTRELAGGRVS
ncbi:MAG: DNA primase [Hydrogenophilales bacterium]|nr:DNA primase [Hydrogenophilales bacterium]